MECRKRLTPGMNGTKRYLEQFGKRLLYVRYRYDKEKQRRFTTAEIIVDEAPLPIARSNLQKALYPHPNQNILIAIEYKETELRKKAKSEGAVWISELKRWKMPYRVAQKLNITDRVENDMSNNGY